MRRFLCGLVVLVAASWLGADTITLHPAGQGYSNQGTPVPARAGTNWDRVNDQTGNGSTGTPATNDGDTSYINMATNNWVDSYALATSNIPAGSTVTGLNVYAVARGATAVSCSFQLFYRVNNANTNTGDITRTSTTYSASNNAWTGLNLAQSAWSTLEIGVQVIDANPDVYVTQVYVIVTYTPPVNSTTVGTVTAASSGCTGIAVNAPYTDDANGGNSLSFRTRSPSGSGVWSSPTPVSHSASPYGFTIPGLTHGATYDAEVTYADADGVTGTNPQTISNILVGPNCTGAGTVAAAQTAGATPSIAVSATYTFDNNGNNTLSYRTRTPSGTGAWVGPTSVSHSASPYAFTISGLICGNSYDVEVTYVDADGIGSGAATQTVSNIVLTNCTTAGAPTATVDSCARITVSAPFANDANANGTATFERGPSGTGPWTAACSGVAGSSPRTCQDNGVLASSTYYYRVTYADTDGVGGTAQPVIGPYSTPSCAVNTVATGPPTAAVDSCSQITVSSPYTNDSNGDSTTTVEYNTSNSWPGTTVCSLQTGASPRVCPVSGLQNATAYWFRVTFADIDGVTGTNPQVVGPFSTRDCKTTAGIASGTVDSCSQITVSAPYTGDWDADGSTAVRRGTAVGGPFGTVVCNALVGASPRTCVDSTVSGSSTYYYQVAVMDADGVDGADPQVIGPFTTPACGVSNTTVGTPAAQATSCKQITVTATFTGDDNHNGTTLVEFKETASGTWLTGCASLTGLSPRQCIIPGLSASTSYDVRVDFADGDGVTGTDPQTITPVSTPACGADQTAPMALVLSPAEGAVIGGAERVKVQVYEPTTPAGGIASVQWKVDTGALAAAAVNANYAGLCGTDCAVYEFDLITTALSNGPHYLTVVATDTAAPTPNVTTVTRAVKVNNAGGKPAGSGTLLRRSHGAELCLDCHALSTHSSQATSDKYGSWAVDCLVCHTSHDTRNIYLVREMIKTPNSGPKPVTFWQGATGLNFLGDTAGAYDDGMCEVCHTRTSHYRNDTSGGDHTHNQSASCVSCHKHGEGFAGAGCNGCHNGPPLQGSHAAHTINAVPSSYTNAAPGSSAAEYGFTCAKCHNATHVNDTHAGTLADPFRVEVAGEATVPDTTGMAYQGTYVGAHSEQGADGRYWAWDNRACGTVYCHGNFPGGTAANTYAWGTSVSACGDCHGAAVATPPSGGQHAAHLGAGHGGSPINLACRDCHESMVDAVPAVTDKTLHVNGGADWDLRLTNPQIGASASYTGTEAGNKTPPSTTYGQCANLYCHSNGNPVNGPSAPYMMYRSIAWSPAPCTNCHTPASDPGCKGCHGFDTSGTAPKIIGQDAALKGSTAHVKHITPYGFMCDDCHSVTMLDRTTNRRNLDPVQTTHTNGQKDVNFSAWPVNQAGGSWEGTGHTCSGTYCHSQGTATTAPFPAPNATADWDGAATTCISCHNGNAGAANKMGTYAHAAHMNQAAYLGTDFMCFRCHQDTVSGSSDTAINTVSYHVNGSRDVKMSNGGSYGTWVCTNAYCHSSGQAATAPIQYYNPPNWNSGTLLANDCKACHGRHADNAFSSVAGEPNYINAGAGTDKANSHAKHVSAAADCTDCHNDTSTTGTAILAGSLLHIDGTRDVRIASAWDTNAGTKADNYSAATKTCSSIKCHGAGSPQWGGTVYCIGCHGDTVDVDNWSTNDGTASTINTTEWTTLGHGQAAIGLGGANPCTYCHADGVNHNAGTNPFRLNGATTDAIALPGAFNAGVNNGNAVCLNCHGTGSFGVDPDGGSAGYAKVNGTKKVDSWHYGVDHTASLDGGMRCWDCHDGHGDDANIKMIGADVLPESTDAYGLGGTRAATPVVFTNNVTGTDFAKVGSPFNGICNVCHTTAAHYKNNSGDGHFGGLGCTASCHLHDQAAATDAFKPKSVCTACHNAPPAGGKHGFHDQVGTAPADYTTVASHATATQYGYACAKCHTGTHFSDSTHAGTVASPYQAQVVFDNTMDPKNPSGAYSQKYPDGNEAGPGIGAEIQYYSTTTSIAGTDGNCATTYCHSNAAPVGGTNLAQTPKWNQATALACNGCHNTQARGDSGTLTDLSNAHGKHIQSTSGETGSYAFKCDECHAQVVVDNPANPWALTSADLGNKANHVQGLHTVNFSSTSIVNNINQSGGSYNQSPNYTCASTYCHSNGATFTAPFGSSTSIAWTATDTCYSCHGTSGTAGAPSYASGSPKANSHAQHAGYSCQTCHSVVVNGTPAITSFALHVNAAYNIAASSGQFTLTVQGTPGTPSQCGSITCHGGNAATWGGTVTCRGCHDSASGETNDMGASFWNNDVTGTINTTEWLYSGHGKTSGTYDVSTNPAAVFSTAPTSGTSECLYCHDDTVTHRTAANPFRLRGASVSGGATGAYSTAAPNAPCLNCHSAGDFGVLVGSNPVKNGTVNTDTTHNGTKHTASTMGGTFCWDCHDPHGDRPSNTNSGGNNIQMIGRTVRVVQDGAYGYTGATGTERSVQYYTNVAPAANDTGDTGSVGKIVETNTALGTAHVGICQACHDDTTSPSPSTAWVKYWENGGYDDPTGTPNGDRYRSGRATAPAGHNTTNYCINCHKHTAKFAGGGGDCRGCHGTSTQGSTPARRAVDADFSSQSHHVGSGGTYMGGALTNFDCIVCHAEGYIDTAPTPDATAANTNYHMNGVIDLRNVDLKAMTDSGTGNVYPYDKDAIGATPDPNSWNSTNSTWMPQMTTNMDPFCLTCHDSNGANTAHVSTWDSPTGSATNPFGDTTVTNEYDQLSRAGVVDIKSRVTSGASSLDVAGEPRYDQAPAGDAIPDPPQGIYSRHAIRGQSLSVYAGRNATWDTAGFFTPVPGSLNMVKFQVTINNGVAYTDYSTQVNDGNGATVAVLNSLSTVANGDWFVVGFTQTFNSVYFDVLQVNRNTASLTVQYWNGAWTNVAGLVDGTRPGTDTLTQVGAVSWTMPASGWITSTINGIGPYYWVRFSVSAALDSTTDIAAAGITIWNSTSVMACADCHTNDGANTTTGNAHGSDSEYLLKDAFGTATEGTLAGNSYNCYLCHNVGSYSAVASPAHTGNDQDYQDYTGSTGAVRVTASATGGNRYGIACMTCHGGGYETAGDTTPQFGTIHGTSQTMGRGQDGGAGTRKAYRFTNGNSMRFYDPGTWTGSGTCYTLSAGDSFGGCTKHPAGTGLTAPAGNRPLKY